MKSVTYQAYVTDSLKSLTNSSKRWYDIVKPKQETKSVNVDDVVTKLKNSGINFE